MAEWVKAVERMPLICKKYTIRAITAGIVGGEAYFNGDKFEYFLCSPHEIEWLEEYNDAPVDDSEAMHDSYTYRKLIQGDFDNPVPDSPAPVDVFSYFPNHGDEDGKNCFTITYGDWEENDDTMVATCDTKEEAIESCKRLNNILKAALQSSSECIKLPQRAPTPERSVATKAK